MNPQDLMRMLGGMPGGMPQQNMVPDDLTQDFKSCAQLALIFEDFASSVLRPYGLDISFGIIGGELLEVMITEGDVKNVILTKEFPFPNPETDDPHAKEFAWIHEYINMTKGNFVVHQLMKMRDEVFKVEVPITNPVYTPPHIDNPVDDEIADRMAEQAAMGREDDVDVETNSDVGDIEDTVPPTGNDVTNEAQANA